MKAFFKFFVALLLFTFGLLLGVVIVVGFAELCRYAITSRSAGIIGVSNRAAPLGVAAPRTHFGSAAMRQLRPVPVSSGRVSMLRAKSDAGVTAAQSCRPEFCAGAISG